MSLRLRIVAAIVLVLAVGSGLGLALAGWQARHWLREELFGAQVYGNLAVLRGFETLARTPDPEHSLRSMVESFDGDRHQQALLVGPDGRVLAASKPLAVTPPPAWFAALLHQDLPPARLAAPLPSGEIIVLQPAETNDMAAVWAEFLDLALVLAVACVAGAITVFGVVTQALRPLRVVGVLLPRIGAGDYAARAPLQGPPELIGLGAGVNAMAVQLAGMRDRNRALEEQLLTLQDEERADIARDLHDEFGPQLFAANVDATMAASLIAQGRGEEALTQVRSITAAIGHMQRLVRDLLGRLRPPRLAELGLSSAVLDLVAFWRARRPDLVFETEIAKDEALPEAAQETLYRVVQESLSNAMRHGDPTRVRIVIERQAAATRVEVVNDGAAATAGAPGYGLTGMAERLAAVGGTLAAGPAPGGEWRVAATLPLAQAAREEAA